MAKPLIVLIDTNEIIYNMKMLNTPLSASFLHILKAKGGKIAIPEVLELEIKKHFRKHVKKYISHIEDGYDNLEILMGSRDDYVVPDDTAIEERIEELFEKIEPFSVKNSFTRKKAKSALIRVIEETPPNSKGNQQFKDSVIWEELVNLSKNYYVHFITRDKGFYQDHNPNKEIAQDLKREVGNDIKMYSQISAFLDNFRDDVPAIDKSFIANQIYISIKNKLEEHLSKKNYECRNLKNYSIEPYITENISELALDYKLSVRILIPSKKSQELVNGISKISGEAKYNTEKKNIITSSISKIRHFDKDGQRLPGGLDVINLPTLTIGRKEVKHRFKKPYIFPMTGDE